MSMFLLMIGVAIATPARGLQDVTSEIECDTGNAFVAEPLLTACKEAEGVGQKICLVTCEQKPDYLGVIQCIRTCLEPAPILFVVATK
jgi:hypothetical protein